MINPHPVTRTDIDIRASADQVIARLQQGRHVEALQLLERRHADERPVVREALDRYVAVGARTELDRLHQSGVLGATPELTSALERLQQATQPPRMPDYSREPGEPNELAGLTDAQKYDIYASMVEARGNQAAFDALRNEESVLLGLRKETSTVASMDDPRTPNVDESQLRRGTGVYDDQIVVLRKDANGERHLFIAGRASTEPTAQYDEHAEPGPEREDTPYAHVAWRRAQGADVNSDGMDDLGRMAEGTIEMITATHANPRRAGTNRAFRPSTEQASAPRNEGLVQRDTNADGWFAQSDVNGVQDLNRTFKIHSGSLHNTDSAGCQTIHPVDYEGFMNAARSNRQQTRWQYVLTSTEGGIFHNVNRERDQDQRPGLQQPAPAPRKNDPGVGRQGRGESEQGLFNDPHLDRAHAALQAGDSNGLDRIAIEFSRSPEGQRMAHLGDQLLARQQELERQQQLQEQMTQTRQAPVMRM